MTRATDRPELTQPTLAEYERIADAYWQETRHRDLSADYALFLRHLRARGAGPYDLLDLGCGPGRDLRHFAMLGHRPIGVDGAARFVEMARTYSGCEVQQQNLLTLRLPRRRFDGVFACAWLFHVPPEALGGVLRVIWSTLRAGGVLLARNPRGLDEQGWTGERYCCYYRLATWRRHLRARRFVELSCAYRPLGLPRAQQQWVTTVWRKP